MTTLVPVTVSDGRSFQFDWTLLHDGVVVLVDGESFSVTERHVYSEDLGVVVVRYSARPLVREVPSR